MKDIYISAVIAQRKDVINKISSDANHRVELELIYKRLKFKYKFDFLEDKDISLKGSSIYIYRRVILSNKEESTYIFEISFNAGNYRIAVVDSMIMGTALKPYYCKESTCIPDIYLNPIKYSKWDYFADKVAEFINQDDSTIEFICSRYINNIKPTEVKIIVDVVTPNGKKISGKIAKKDLVNFVKNSGSIVTEKKASIPKLDSRMKVKNNKQSLDNARQIKSSSDKWSKALGRNKGLLKELK